MKLLQISAWNDSGGGFTHRLLDGHPGLRSWPFELLMGRDGIDVDGFGEDWFRGRFRWARFGAALADRDGAALFDLVSDAELKGVLADPASAKHRDFRVAVDLSEWRRETARAWAAAGRFDQPSFVEAYVETFLRLLDGGTPHAPEPRRVLAHSPVAILDAPEIWADVPDTLFVCVVRSPLAGYADMRRRHPGLDPARYAAKWSLVNAAHVLWAGKAPQRVKIVALADLLARREATLRDVCAFAGLAFDPVVLTPSWRGRPLSEAAMGPFGGVPAVSLEREAELERKLEPATRGVLAEGTAAVGALLAGPGVAAGGNSIDSRSQATGFRPE